MKWPPASVVADLTAADRAALLGLGTLRWFESGQLLITEGNHDTNMAVILNGCAKVVGLRSDGGSVLLAIRGRGDLVGEFAAIDGGPRSASVLAASATRARTISGKDFRGFLRDCPLAAEAVQRSITAKVRSATHYRIDTGGGSATVRVARSLDTLARTHGRDEGGMLRIDLPLSQGDLASLAGASQASVQRALRALRTAGIVATDYRVITVRDPAALSRAAQEGITDA